MLKKNKVSAKSIGSYCARVAKLFFGISSTRARAIEEVEVEVEEQ
jgi:hypothetical protein